MRLDYTDSDQTIIQDSLSIAPGEQIELLLQEDNVDQKWMFTKMPLCVDWQEPTTPSPQAVGSQSSKLKHSTGQVLRLELSGRRSFSRRGTIVIEKVNEEAGIIPLQTIIIDITPKVLGL